MTDQQPLLDKHVDRAEVTRAIAWRLASFGTEGSCPPGLSLPKLM
jgi:hypothetical protein